MTYTCSVCGHTYTDTIKKITDDTTSTDTDDTASTDTDTSSDTNDITSPDKSDTTGDVWTNTWLVLIGAIIIFGLGVFIIVKKKKGDKAES